MSNRIVKADAQQINVSFQNVTCSAGGPSSKFDLLQRKAMDGHCQKLLPKASLQMLIFGGWNPRSVVDELFGKLHETPHISFRPSVRPSTFQLIRCVNSEPDRDVQSETALDCQILPFQA